MVGSIWDSPGLRGMPEHGCGAPNAPHAARRSALALERVTSKQRCGYPKRAKYVYCLLLCWISSFRLSTALLVCYPEYPLQRRRCRPPRGVRTVRGAAGMPRHAPSVPRDSPMHPNKTHTLRSFWNQSQRAQTWSTKKLATSSEIAFLIKKHL